MIYFVSSKLIHFEVRKQFYPFAMQDGHQSLSHCAKCERKTVAFFSVTAINGRSISDLDGLIYISICFFDMLLS